ncbi:MAG: flavodoxin [Ruminococcus sp.]|nr:flavodoxin [Ruminococcus sp.]
MKHTKRILTAIAVSMIILTACGASNDPSGSKAESVISSSSKSGTSESQNNSEQSSKNDNTKKSLVVYFSTPEITDATTTASQVFINGKVYGTTEYMAHVIHENTDSDLFRIELEEPYGSDVPDRAKNEQDNGILPKLSSHIEKLDSYDKIYVGYPTWWYDMPQVMYSFFDEYDFSGKTIIPFNSHGGSQFSGSIEKITKLEPNANVITDGMTLPRENVAESEEKIIEWVKQF